ncbi:hypothetical protein M3Y98_00909500 [Aphelenchoides besseyi]|nr:hypothetical protein M3Y98_00909500 [Aphelenchoides besseyi]KAI6193546.1 hypothetical protein M3Y96_01029700 [Aphelenchoides besseyi]
MDIDDDNLTINDAVESSFVLDASTRFWLFTAGVLFFISARTIAHKAATFYLSSAVIGVVFSVLFFAVFIRRFLPKRVFMVPLEVIGWPLISWIYYYGYNHAANLMTQNWKWIALYITASALLSLTVCYVSDVTSNVRIQNVVQWALQLIAGLMIIYASNNVPISVIVILVAICFDHGYSRYVNQLVDWMLKRPPTREYMTLKEYEQQGAEYTQRELEKLRLSLLDDCRHTPPNRSIVNRLSRTNPDQVAHFMLTSQDVSVRSIADYQKQFIDHVSDDEDLMEVDEADDGMLTDFTDD